MSKHDDRVSIKDMLSHASEAVELLDEASREELGHDRVMQLALTRLVEIIGAAGHLEGGLRCCLSGLRGRGCASVVPPGGVEPRPSVRPRR